MADKALSVTKIVAGIGGVLLVASFFLPLVSVKEGRAPDEFFGVGDLRRQIERSRETEAVRPLIEPALKELEVFATSPSLRNFSSVIASANEIVGIAASSGIAPELRSFSTILSATRWGLWLLPLVGVIQALLPALTRFRDNTNFFGLVARFTFGLIFAMIALLPLLGAPESAQASIGSAVYMALLGGLLMIVAGIFGVTRRNWIFVFLAQGGIVGAVIYGIKMLVEMNQH